MPGYFLEGFLSLKGLIRIRFGPGCCVIVWYENVLHMRGECVGESLRTSFPTVAYFISNTDPESTQMNHHMHIHRSVITDNRFSLAKWYQGVRFQPWAIESSETFILIFQCPESVYLVQFGHPGIVRRDKGPLGI